MPALPVSTEMEPRYALAGWLAAATTLALAVGGDSPRRWRAAAVALLALALPAALVANRVAWRAALAEQRRASTENLAFLELGHGDLLRAPSSLPASLAELRWLKEEHLGLARGAGWFYDDLYLCGRRPVGRVWGFDPRSGAVLRLPSRAVRALRRDYCSRLRQAALDVEFSWTPAGLLWRLGPYAFGRWSLVVDDGREAVEVPRRGGYRLASDEVRLRVGYASPEGWITFSPELALRRAEGSLRYTCPPAGRE
jgi:hypothetical protein